MNLRLIIVPAYLGLCLLFGGASAAGFAANLLLQLAALPLIGWSLWTLSRKPVLNPLRSLLLLALLLVVVMVVELIPLPPAVWTLLPGRTAVAQGYQLLGQPLPYLPLSLAPANTLASLLWLLPAFAVLLATTVLGAFRARWLAFVIIGVAIAGTGIGTLQLVGGEDSALYFYEITNFGVAVGFFANANHAASLLLVAIPFLAALQTQLLSRARSTQQRSATMLLTSAGFGIIAVGLITNLSLAGIGLGAPVALASYFLVARSAKPRWWAIGLMAIMSIATFAAIVIGPFHNNLIGKQESNADLSRQTSFALTLRAARGYFPIGSGIGTFQPVYHTQEPIDRTSTTYMNHAHSDWIEIFLETGLVGLGLVALLLWWWSRRVMEIFSLEEPDHYARAATIASAALIAHSLVDYPLRTAALSTIFVLCLALMARARPYVRVSQRRERSSARHLVVE